MNIPIIQPRKFLPSQSTETCATCRFSWEQSGLFICRRYPPQSPTPDNAHLVLTQPGLWCGEYQTKPETIQ